ncbi:hypothetical protein [Vulcanisaeta moutnovskia]|nr:hypothetical protein [Vulcanisaeta moutnovskia]
MKEPLSLIGVELRNRDGELIGTSTTTYWITRIGKTINDIINELRGAF